MAITIRKLRDVFIREEWREAAQGPFDTEEDGYLIPEVEEWCKRSVRRKSGRLFGTGSGPNNSCRCLTLPGYLTTFREPLA